jgi:hypothetical protein
MDWLLTNWLLADETIADSAVLIGTCVFAFALYLVGRS